MVSIQRQHVAEKFTVEEFIDHVRSNVDLDDHASVVENAWALRALANDRDFVLDGYHRELKAHWRSESINSHSPQSIRLGSGPGFFVRSNIWLPMKSDEHEAFERQLYSYDLAHDHNFDFVTVGYFGPGYETDLYEYDYDQVDGVVGERVDLRPQGTHRLDPGSVMVYEGGRDVHVQRTPIQPSVSLNLMCTSRRLRETQQYLFDVQTSTIANGAGDLGSMRMFLLEVLRSIHDEETVDLLGQFARDHPAPRSRAYALNVLRDLDAFEAEQVEAASTAEVVRLSRLDLVQGAGSRDFSRL